MVDLLRQVPLRSLTHVLPVLRLSSTMRMFTNTLPRACKRAVSQLEENSDLLVQEKTATVRTMSSFADVTTRKNTGDVIQNVFLAQKQTMLQTRQQVAQMDSGKFQAK